MTPVSERQAWMDVVRGTCITLVVALHAYSLIKDFPGVGIIEAFNKIFFPYRMPVLMFLSGLLLHRSLNKTGWAYFSGKFSSIFWPFLVWSVVVLFAEERLTLINLLKVPVSSPTLLWYLWFLFAYYMIALALRKAGVDFLIFGALSLIASIFLPDFLRISRFFYLLFFFLLGAAVVERKFRIDSAFVLIVFAAVSIVGAVLSVADISESYNALYAWAPISLSLLLYSIPKGFYEFSGSSTIRWIGRNSLVFYVAHFPVQVLFFKYASFAHSGNVSLLYFSIFLVGVFVPAALVVLRDNSRVVSALFDFRVITEKVRT